MMYLSVLIVKSVQETLQYFVGVVDPLRILANNPYHGCASFGFIKRVKILAEGRDNRLIFVGILSENVLNKIIPVMICRGVEIHPRNLFPEKTKIKL